ncbi:hypothetical protein GCM10010174_03040 [Kutzneria viridogrisea]
MQTLLRDRVEPGLTEAEFNRVEEHFGLTFADDHRVFLSAGLPVGRRWPDWRDGAEQTLLDQLAWPVEGLLFDVEKNGLWLGEWGERPRELSDAVAVAQQHLAGVPTLIPVFGHRYLPGIAGSWGLPVLSVVQSDIIVYGETLADYIQREFANGPERYEAAEVPFWGQFL